MIKFWFWSGSRISICIATLVRRALVEVSTVPVLLIVLCVVFPVFHTTLTLLVLQEQEHLLKPPPVKPGGSQNSIYCMYCVWVNGHVTVCICTGNSETWSRLTKKKVSSSWGAVICDGVRWKQCGFGMACLKFSFNVLFLVFELFFVFIIAHQVPFSTVVLQLH